MKTALLSLVALTLMAAVGHAQKVGDSEQAVLKALGNPPLSRASGDHQTWMYPNGTKVVIKGGVVVEVKIGTAQPQDSADERALAEEASRVSPPKILVPRAAATAQNRPESTWRKASDFHRTGFGLGLAIMAYVLIFICGIIIIIEAFRTSFVWGLAVLIIPFAQIFFVMSHWAETKKPFLITWLVGLPLLIASIMI